MATEATVEVKYDEWDDDEGYPEDVVPCKYYEQFFKEEDYCITGGSPSLIPVKCGGDARNCSLHPPVMLNIGNILYWRRR